MVHLYTRITTLTNPKYRSVHGLRCAFGSQTVSSLSTCRSTCNACDNDRSLRRKPFLRGHRHHPVRRQPLPVKDPYRPCDARLQHVKMPPPCRPQCQDPAGTLTIGNRFRSHSDEKVAEILMRTVTLAEEIEWKTEKIAEGTRDLSRRQRCLIRWSSTSTGGLEEWDRWLHMYDLALMVVLFLSRADLVDTG